MTRDYAAPDWRGLCEELTEALASTGEAASGSFVDLRDRARAALAQPEPKAVGPSDKELLELHGWMTDEWAANHDFELPPSQYARAVLARWGRPAPAPAGEVAELARLLRLDAAFERGDGMPQAAARFDRAADLLERQAAPVPVSERLPGTEDCDAEGRCWVHQPHEACPESPAWELMLAKYASANYEAVCWLPAHALPLPSGEVQP